MIKLLSRSLVTAAAAFACMQAGATAVVNYSNFNDTTGLQLNGSAASVNGALSLTPANYSQSGSVFSTNRISLANNASFSTHFQFRFSGAGVSDGSGPGADGMVFTIQTLSNNVGSVGGGIGYQGISNSIGVEFDTWNNGWGDHYSSNHVGFNVNGDINSLSVAPVTEADLNNGQVWNAWIDYDGSSHQLEVRLGQSAVRPTAALLSYTRDIALDLGSTDAFVGFTAATGGAYASHELLSWQLNNEFAPIPEPGSLALVSLALAGVGVGVARRKQARG